MSFAESCFVARTSCRATSAATRIKGLFAALGLLCIAVTAASADTVLAYDYPLKDAFVATVVGTPADGLYKTDVKIPLKRRSMQIFPDREPPEVFFYDKKMHYSYALQKGPAPLIFCIAGTGGSNIGSGNRKLLGPLYQAGFHVVLLASPTFMNFVISASKSQVPGHAYDDAADLYRVMEMIWAKLESKAEVTSFNLVGYSLGAFNAGFVANLDAQRGSFDFRRVMMLNSPVRLYSSISLLDRMLDNLPGGEDNFPEFFNTIVERLGEVYKRSDSLQFGEDTLYKVYEIYKPPDEVLGALIGTAFRLSAANMVFASDVATNFGYVKPSNVILKKGSDLQEYSRVATRLGFTDYFHTYFYPYHKALDPTVNREDLINKMSLTDIEDFLSTADNVYAHHNANDIILAPGEIDFFPRVFGERATIYPYGGHLGNMDYRQNVEHMLEVLTR
jgi:hypothetical protein